MQRSSRLQPLIPLSLLTLAVIIIFTPLFDRVVREMSDYIAHIVWTRELLVGNVNIIHVVFHGMLMGVHALGPFDWETAAVVVMLICYVGMALISYLWLRPVTRRGFVALLGAFAVLVITPITVFTWATNNHYLGYIGINVLHNPTMIVLRLFGLATFIVALSALDGRLKFSIKTLLAVILLVILTMFAKPNFALDLVPALVVFLVVRAGRTRNLTGLRLSVFGLILPMLILLPIQYVAQYTLIPLAAPGGIIFAPLGTVLQHEPRVEWLALKFLMSIAFPVAVTLLYRHSAFSDNAMLIGWLVFLAGAAQMYFFAESGDRFNHGNFWWSAQIGLFVLFVAAIRLWLTQARRDWRSLLSLAVLSLHLISGAVMINRVITAAYPW